jgi:signal transduction histidine kinase
MITLRLRVAAAVVTLYLLGVALALIFVPIIIDLEEAAGAWSRGLRAYGVGLALVLAWRAFGELSPLRDRPPGDPERRRAAHDYPFQTARLCFTSAILGGALTWPYLTRFSGLTLPQTLAGAVTTYLLLALPVLFIYHATRQLLRAEAAGEGPVPGTRQSVRLRVVLAVQLPVVICMAGLVLVEQSNAQRHNRDVNAFFDQQYTNVLGRVLRVLPDLEARRHVVSELTPPAGIRVLFETGGDAEGVGVVVDPDLPRPLWLRLPPLFLFAAVAAFAALLGAWLAREVTAEIGAARRALEALKQEALPVPSEAGGTSMSETTALVQAWHRTLLGFRERRDALDRATAARRQADQAKARFLAHLSHELKSPLNTILGFSEVLLTGLDGPLAPAQQTRMGILWRSGESLLRFILSLLDLARLEASDATAAQDLAPTRVDAEALAEAIRTQYRRDPLDQLRLVLVITPGEPPAETFIELQRTARAVLLCAGMLTDAIESGTVHVSLTPGATGGLEVLVWLGERVAEPHDAPRLCRQLEPAASGSMRMNAAATALALVERIVRLQKARLEVQTRTADAWPRFRIELPPA